MPGRAFASPRDFNDQLADWLPRANARYSRTRHGRPAELFVRDREAMRPLSPVAPASVFRSSVRLPRDYYVRVFSNDYSVDPGAIGRIVDVEADLEEVTVSADGRLLASHESRWARHQIFTDPVHVDKAATLRRIHRSVKADGQRWWKNGTCRSMTNCSASPSPTRPVSSPGPAGERGRKGHRLLRPCSPRPADRRRLPEPRRPGTGSGLVTRGIPRRCPLPGSRRTRGLRGCPADQGSKVPRTQAAGGIQLRPPARRGPEPCRAPGHRVFLEEAKNVVLLGPPGTGKTHLAVGIGSRAARAGHRVLFDTATGWVSRLAEAHDRGRLPQKLACIS